MAPQTSTSDVTAEGELEVTARIGAAEVLGELRDGGRSGANSEYGDDDRDQVSGVRMVRKSRRLS